MFIKVADVEKRQLLNNLSDAIKECQLRFGGKRELATDLDGRVCFLCLKLESIFLHGIKKNSQSNSALLNAGLNSLKNLKNNNLLKNTSSLLSQFFDDTKLPIPHQLKQNIENISNGQSEISFWPFIKQLMNKLDIERFELLANITNDIGRQRAWIRSCLNEHCIERYTIAVLSNQALLKEYYEDWCFLLDSSYTSTLPMLLSGLQSILFAINIDNPNLNIPTKLNNNNNNSANLNPKLSNTNETNPIKINSKYDPSSPITDFNYNSNSNMSKSFSGNSLAVVETTSVKLRKKSSNNIGATSSNFIISASSNNLSKKVRKNNVVVFDNDEETTSYNGDINNKLSKSPISNKIINENENENQFEFNLNLNEDTNENKSNVTVSKTSSSSNLSFKSDSDKKEFTILTNPINYEIKNKSSKLKEINEHKREDSIKLSDASPDSSSSDKMSDSFSKFDACNLIPINNSSFNVVNSNLVDNISINSYQSELSNEINFNANQKAFDQNSLNSPNEIFPIGSFSNNLNHHHAENGSTTSKTELNDKKEISPEPKNKTNLKNGTDNLSLSELREVVLTMIQRKDHVEGINKQLKEKLNEEISKNAGLIEKINVSEKESSNLKQFYENKIQNLENENKLLKDQLKKYVSAVQMIRSNNSTNNLQDTTNQENIPAIPALNQDLLRDFSFEAEQYEKKLIQVAEMHGELMEFNSRLHKMLNFKTLQVEKLKNELIELRGPLPNEMIQNTEETVNLEFDIESLNHLNTTLISVWIPSVFLRSDKNSSHHVYQVYLRVKDEEWNIYRRFSHFYNLNNKLKDKYPIINTISFPKKKAIGNKDAKFVENRRKLLQDYLRKIINVISQIDRDLNFKPCRETLIKAIPFFSDQDINPMNSYSVNPRNIPAVNQNFTYTSSYGSSLGNSLANSYGNSLVQASRNNTITSNVFLNGNDINSSASPLRHNRNQNELLYTGL